MIGKSFSHYVILEQAGAGGMGVVFRARDETLQRDVALKLPTTQFLTDQEARARILREARAASALNHPNICTIYEVGEFERQPYIAMEYIPGEPLSRRIPPKGMPAESVLNIGAQIADALDHAHSNGILHRDLKSPNVRITSTGQLKVLDFGLAVNLKEESLEGLTRSTQLDTGNVSGTLAYMAPELLQGKTPDVRSDIWSLGVLLYELAAGTLPFNGRTGFEVSTAILRETPSGLPMHVTPGLRAVIARCLAKDPEQRYQHASEIRAALQALHSDTGVTPRTSAAAVPSKSWAWYSLGAAILLAALVGVFLLYARLRRPIGPIQPAGKLRLFLSSDADLSGPSLSPDGKMVAYVRGSGGREDLYVSRLSGGEHVRLTNDDSQKGDPQFSPDGEKIVFVRHLPSTIQSELCVIPALGGTVVPLVQAAENPAWSPDGTRLAFILRKPGQPETLATSAADGSDVQIVLKGDDVYPFFGRVAWSLDGKVLAISRSRGGANRDLWTIPAQGGAPSRFSKDAQGEVSDSPVYSHDGLGIIYRSTRGGASNLWWQSLAGEPPVQLTSGPGPDNVPSVARNGTIAFLNSRSRCTLFLYSLADGHRTTVLTDSSRMWAPAFSPDGKEIAYSRDQPDGSWHIWMVSAEGGAARQVSSGKVPEIYPRFARDGKTIFFNSWGTEPLAISQMSWQGGPSKPAARPTVGSDAYADPSPDGRSIVFARAENNVSHIYIAPADGTGEAWRVLESPGTVPRWSPDGNWISFSPNRSFSSGVFIVHPDGTGSRRIAAEGGWAVWFPDGDQIGYQVPGPDGNEQIRVYSMKTGQTRTLSNLPFAGVNYPFDISRDGHWLATTNAQHLSDEIWLLEPAEKK